MIIIIIIIVLRIISLYAGDNSYYLLRISTESDIVVLLPSHLLFDAGWTCTTVELFGRLNEISCRVNDIRVTT